MNKIVKVITASVLTVSMCGCAVSADEAKSTATADTVSAEKKSSKKDAREAYTSQQTGKDETVYVFTGADGSMNHMVVSDTLHTAGKKGAVEDYSNLDNIENVSGDEKYSSDDNGNITWTSDGSDISYQGTTDKELPVDVKITYYLNGNEVSPEEIKGQSGHVKVHFDYTNNAETTITSNGEEKTVKVPFGMVTGLTLDASKFTNVTVTNGKMNQYNDSDVIYGLALPGLKESLETASVSDIDLTSVNIPEYFEFEADTTDFDIDLCMTIATSNLLSLLNTDDLNVSDFSGSIDQLTSSGQKLVDGTKSLKDGTSQLRSGADSLDSGAQSLLNGAGTLSDGASSLSTGTNDLANGAQSLSDGASQVNDGASQLKDGAQSLADGAKILDDGVASAMTGAQSLSDGLGKISSNSSTLNSNYSDIADGVLSTVNAILTSSGLGTVSASDYPQKFASYLGLTDALSKNTIQAIANSAGINDANTVKLLLYLAATSNGNDASSISTSNLSSKLAEQGTRVKKAEVTGEKVAAASKSVKNKPYTNDNAVVNAINVVKSEEASQVTENAVYNALLIETVAKVKNMELTDTDAAFVLAYSCEQNRNASAVAEDNLLAAAADFKRGTRPQGSAGLDNAAVKGVVDAVVASKKAEVENANNQAIYNELVNKIKNSAKIDDAPAQFLLVYACKNYAISSSDDISKAVSSARAEISDANTVSEAKEKLESGDKDATTLVNGIATQVAAESAENNTQLSSLLKLLNGVYAFQGGLRQYTDHVDEAYAGAQELVKGLGTLKTGADQLNTGAQKLLSGTTALAAGTKSLADGAVSLNDGAQKLKSGAATLYNGSLTLYSGVKTLKNGTSSLKTGVVTLDEGAATLESGMEQFYEEGIKKIGDVLGKDLPAVVDSLKGLTNAGADYKTFSGALDDNNNSCKFIFKTEFDSDNK